VRRPVPGGAVRDRRLTSAGRRRDLRGMEEVQERIRERVEAMPALNAVVLELIRLTSDEGYALREVVETLASDTSLAARVLRVANSAYYGLPRRVESLQMAVSMIGIRALRRLVMNIATYDLFRVDLLGYGLDGGGLWAHSLAASLAAEEICELVSYPHREEMRLVALLHDVGKMVLSPLLGRDDLEKEGQSLLAGGRAGAEAEKRIFGVDHAAVGAMVADRWNLSPRFVEILRCHHAPEDSPNLPRGSAVVSLADTMVRELIRSEEPFKAIMGLDRTALQLLHLTEADLVPHLVRINSRILEEIRYWTGDLVELPTGEGDAGVLVDEWEAAEEGLVTGLDREEDSAPGGWEGEPLPEGGEED